VDCSGGREIRDWLAGTRPSALAPAQVLAYEPLKAWSSGPGIMGWSSE
jgi:hypothetical protein